MDNIDPILSKMLYDQIGKEVASRQFAPGPQMQAVAAAMGDKSKVESLYIQFRFQDLLIEMKMQADEIRTQAVIAKKQEDERIKQEKIKQEKDEIRRSIIEYHIVDMSDPASARRDKVLHAIADAKTAALSCYAESGSMPKSIRCPCLKCSNDDFVKKLNEAVSSFIIRNIIMLFVLMLMIVIGINNADILPAMLFGTVILVGFAIFCSFPIVGYTDTDYCCTRCGYRIGVTKKERKQARATHQ